MAVYMYSISESMYSHRCVPVQHGCVPVQSLVCSCTVTGVFLYSHWCVTVQHGCVPVQSWMCVCTVTGVLYVYELIQTSNPSLFDTKLWDTLEEEADEVPLSSKNTPVWSGREKV